MKERNKWGPALTNELYERWPKDENGEPEEPVFLGTAMNINLFDELTVNMLEAYGIPCIRQYPGNGSFGKLILGMSGEGTEIYVPKSMLEDAAALCSANASDAADSES
ncbi:MAG: hypothetical protein K6F56_00735 [Oscillospiraceae bacterium]|nr:hypothetical protein [Oscillospiraceae bacterium]